MKDKIFLDTNIFIYSIDSSPHEKAKSLVARELIRDHIHNESGVISIQVLQEFYQVATQKIGTPLPSDQALEYLNYISILETVQPEFHMIVSAIRLHQKYTLSFWDALILQAASTAGCSKVLSEDLKDGFQVKELIVENPFINSNS
jgi:predicted nucleic acid-binding protein